MRGRREPLKHASVRRRRYTVKHEQWRGLKPALVAASLGTRRAGIYVSLCGNDCRMLWIGAGSFQGSSHVTVVAHDQTCSSILVDGAPIIAPGATIRLTVAVSCDAHRSVISHHPVPWREVELFPTHIENAIALTAIRRSNARHRYRDRQFAVDSATLRLDIANRKLEATARNLAACERRLERLMQQIPARARTHVQDTLAVIAP